MPMPLRGVTATMLVAIDKSDSKWKGKEERGMREGKRMAVVGKVIGLEVGRK